MSVRARLILAFLVLSVLPLTAVTLYSYAASVGAFRAAVASESGRMASELQQRLDTVTAELGRQVRQVWEPAQPPAAPGEGAESDVPVEVQVVERMAAVLGDSAKLLDRVEFRPMRPPSGSPPRHPRPGHVERAPRVDAAPPVPGVSAAPPAPRVGAVPPVPPPSAAPAAPAPPVPPPVVIDLRAVMAQVEKEAAAEGVPPEVTKHLRELTEQLGPALHPRRPRLPFRRRS